MVDPKNRVLSLSDDDGRALAYRHDRTVTARGTCAGVAVDSATMTNADPTDRSWILAVALLAVAVVLAGVAYQTKQLAMGAVTAVSITALVVFFLSKTRGFGPFTVSTLILLVALI